MIAARIARLLVRKEEPSDMIGEVLFWELDWFEAHPLICAAGLVMTIVLAGVLEVVP